jgi:hypothetical protein
MRGSYGLVVKPRKQQCPRGFESHCFRQISNYVSARSFSAIDCGAV